jgi:hypothetical protein
LLRPIERAFYLARVNRLDPGLDHISVVHRKVQAQPDDSGSQRRNIDSHLNQPVVDQIQLQQQWRAHQQPGDETHRQCHGLSAYKSIRANSTPTTTLMTLEQRNMTTVHHRPVASIS